MSQFIDSEDHLVNPALLKMAYEYKQAARQKRAFVPGGDPSQAGGGGGDPAAAGGDPSAGGGAPPPDPSAGGGGGGDASAQISQLQAQVQAMQQQQMTAQQAGGAGAGAGALKPKIDEPSVLLSILKVQARIADQLGVKIPASEMVANQQDLQGLAAASQTGSPMPGMDPSATTGPPGGAPGGGQGGGIPPMGGVGDISGGVKGGYDRFVENGTPYKTTSTKLAHNGNWAGAIAALVRQRRSA